MVRQEGSRWDVGTKDNAITLERFSEDDERVSEDVLQVEEARHLAALSTKHANKIESSDKGKSKDKDDSKDKDSKNKDDKHVKDKDSKDPRTPRTRTPKTRTTTTTTTTTIDPARGSAHLADVSAK